jgi:hypothetical protein
MRASPFSRPSCACRRIRLARAVSPVFTFFMRAEQSIVVDQKSPGDSDSPQGLILFDGVCVLCSRGCHFVICSIA